MEPSDLTNSAQLSNIVNTDVWSHSFRDETDFKDNIEPGSAMLCLFHVGTVDSDGKDSHDYNFPVNGQHKRLMSVRVSSNECNLHTLNG